MDKLYSLQFAVYGMLGPGILESIYPYAYPAREAQVSGPWLFALTRPGTDCRGIPPIR